MIPVGWKLARKDARDGEQSTSVTTTEVEAEIVAIYPDAVMSEPDGDGTYYVYADQSILDDGGEPIAKISRLWADE